MKQLQLCLLIIVIFYGCADPKKKEQEISTSFSFEVINSLDLKIIGNPMLVNVSPKANRFIFYDYPSKEFVFTDASGEGFLWMEKASNEEVEEDFLRVYKVKLVDK